jgi:hypothetical protein
MFNLDDEKDKLIHKLSEQYSQNIIDMEEYGRILDYINKIEKRKEIEIIEKIINENMTENTKLSIIKNNEIIIPKSNEKHLSMFSWRTTNIKSINGYGGKFFSIFGANRVIVDNLPKGRTVLNVNSIFGLTEIIVPDNVKVVNKTIPIFSGIFTPNEIMIENEETSELYIVGRAVFGNITVMKIDKDNKIIYE